MNNLSYYICCISVIGYTILFVLSSLNEDNGNMFIDGFFIVLFAYLGFKCYTFYNRD